MKISHDEIRQLAQLARIEIPADQFDKLAADLADIVSMVDQLQQIDLSDVQDVQMDLSEQSNVFREDVPQPSMAREQVLMNAPKQEAGCILVPRVIE